MAASIASHPVVVETRRREKYDQLVAAKYGNGDTFGYAYSDGGTPTRIDGLGACTPRAPGSGQITAAGPNNAANVWNRRNLFTYTDNFQWQKGRHQITAGVWFQRLRDNENTASRRLGQASFASLQTTIS